MWDIMKDKNSSEDTDGKKAHHEISDRIKWNVRDFRNCVDQALPNMMPVYTLGWSIT
jgi:hypothetical protein